jgi:hypothetical protein
MFTEWMDAVFPDWYALLSALLIGAFGVIALGIVICGIAPDLLFAWLPPVTAFCGAVAGYRFREKRFSAGNPNLLPALGAGTGPAIAAAVLQVIVDRNFFGTHPSLLLLAVFFACGIFGAAGGQWLCRRYEMIDQNRPATKESPKS